MHLEERDQIKVRAIHDEVKAQRVKKDFFCRQDPLAYLFNFLYTSMRSLLQIGFALTYPAVRRDVLEVQRWLLRLGTDYPCHISQFAPALLCLGGKKYASGGNYLRRINDYLLRRGGSR